MIYWNRFPLIGVILSLIFTQSASAPLAPTQNFEPDRWAGITVAQEAGMDIPCIYQYDYPNVLIKVSGEERSVLTSGCGPTSLAMVVKFYHGDAASEVSPETLFQFAIDEGWYAGDGLGHATLSKVARAFKVRGSWNAGSRSKILRELKAGRPVIAHMNTGLFTPNSGHYILLTGVTADGLILINDPNSALMSTLAYPIETILREAKTDEPFFFTEKRG